MSLAELCESVWYPYLVGKTFRDIHLQSIGIFTIILLLVHPSLPYQLLCIFLSASLIRGLLTLSTALRAQSPVNYV